MTTVDMKAGKGHLTTHSKRMIGESMYAKGKRFVAAALLLRQRHGYEYVVLHLLCQGIEITLKGLLIMRDYDKYKDRLKRAFGHNIKKLVAAAVSEFNVRPLRPPLETELEMLSSLYSRQRLRYGTFYDVLVDPETIQSRLALRKIAAVIRLADRHMFPRSKIT